MNKQCEECGTPFEAKKKWQKFCSVPCRNNHHNAKETVRTLTTRIRVLEEKDRAQHQLLDSVFAIFTSTLPREEHAYFNSLWQQYDSARHLAESKIKKQQDVASPGGNGSAAHG